MAAMFAASSQQWQQTQNQMASLVSFFIVISISRFLFLLFTISSKTYEINQFQSFSNRATHIPRAAFNRPGSTAAPAARQPYTRPPSASTSSSATSGGTASASIPTERTNYHKAGESTKPPPVGYICYRCGQKGHWIQDCPTNADKAWDDRPRIKRTTGIPKSFLTTVEGPAGGDTNAPAGMMVTAEGGFVIAKPDALVLFPTLLPLL